MDHGSDFGLCHPGVRQKPDDRRRNYRQNSESGEYRKVRVVVYNPARHQTEYHTMLKSKFEDSEGPEAVRSSHGDLGFVVEPFDNTAGELLMRLEVIEDELAMLT